MEYNLNSPQTGAAPATGADYTSLREIGAGSYGRVWLVQDKHGEYWAVKIIYRHLFENDIPYKKERAGVERFRELSGSSLSLLKVTHVGIHDEEGYFYYLMELADDRRTGRTILPESYQPRTLKWELESSGQRQRLPAADCLRIMISLTAGLEELHGAGLIHRDIKPANIIFINGEPKLADIGLVTSKDLTHTIVSTPGYYLEGEPQSERSDIYGLGKVLYEILTGLNRNDDVDFPRLPEGVRAWPDRDLVLELNEVISKACARNPRNRYQSARQMKGDLLNLSHGASLRGPKKAVLYTMAAGFVLAVLSCLAWFSEPLRNWLYSRSGSEPEITVNIPSNLKGPRRANVQLGLRASGSFLQTTNRWTNSIGMVFVPVPALSNQVSFCIWETRVMDFRAFVEATGHTAVKGMNSTWPGGFKKQGHTWMNPGFAQGPTHPVTGVNFGDAKAFCRWLTAKERNEMILPEGVSYRLPTDGEWSWAVGIGQDEPVASPSQKNERLRGIYPWGKDWPPPPGSGNYAGSEARDADWPLQRPICKNCRDAYPRTSPVGSFDPNQFGLYDMGGNLWEWCEDWFGEKHRYRTLRGASWCDSVKLFSASRLPEPPGARNSNYGFRCVLASEGPNQP